MRTSHQECCGWTVWCEMAGIDVHGRRITGTTEAAPPASRPALPAPGAPASVVGGIATLVRSAWRRVAVTHRRSRA